MNIVAMTIELDGQEPMLSVYEDTPDGREQAIQDTLSFVECHWDIQFTDEMPGDDIEAIDAYFSPMADEYVTFYTGQLGASLSVVALSDFLKSPAQPTA
jgi:hypothetical protein